jgi:hypothetical protein
VAVVPIDGRMGVLSFSQLAVTTCQNRSVFSFSWSFLVQVAVPTPHAIGRLVAVCPYMAKLVVAVTFVTLSWALYASILIQM